MRVMMSDLKEALRGVETSVQSTAADEAELRARLAELQALSVERHVPQARERRAANAEAQAAQALERRSALERDLDLYAATADERFDVELDHDDRHLLDNEYSWVSSVVGDKWRVIR